MKRRTFRFTTYLLLVFFIFFLISCNSEDGDSDPPGDPALKTAEELTEDDFEVKAKTFSKSGFQNLLNRIAHFRSINKDFGAHAGSLAETIRSKLSPSLRKMPQAEISGDFMKTNRMPDIEADNLGELCYAAGLFPCMDECLEGEISAVFTPAEEGEFRAVQNDTEFDECAYYQFDTVDFSLVYDHVKVRDAEGEEADIEGEKLADVFGSSSPYCAAQFNMRQHLRLHLDSTFNGEPYFYTGRYMISMNDFSDFNAPCSISEDNRLPNCRIQIAYKFASSHSEDFNERIVLSINEVVANPEDAYFTSGTIDFVVNDWEGVMTYDGDGSTPPVYEAENTRTGERISGIYRNFVWADAGPDRNVETGALVVLDGSGSRDIWGSDSSISYSWSFAAVPAESSLTTADIAEADTATPSFTSDESGIYRLSLLARNDEGDASRDEATLTAASPVQSSLTDADIVKADAATPSFTSDIEVMASTP